jgi:hypothetical protein
MRRAARWSKLCRTKVAITLELEVSGETLAGMATVLNGRSRQFTGWLGLMGAIGSLLESEEPEAGAAQGARSRTEGPGLARFSATHPSVNVMPTK